MTVAVGIGTLVEELFFVRRENELIPQYRELHEVRRKILREVEERAGEGIEEIISNIAMAVKRHAKEVEEVLAGLGADPVKASLESAVEEYAEVLRLDVPVGSGKTLEDMLYESRDEVLDRLHEIMTALFMEYVEMDEACGGGCPPEAAQRLEKLAALELAAYVVYGQFQKQKIDGKAAAALSKILDEIFS